VADALKRRVHAAVLEIAAAHAAAAARRVAEPAAVRGRGGQRRLRQRVGAVELCRRCGGGCAAAGARGLHVSRGGRLAGRVCGSGNVVRGDGGGGFVVGVFSTGEQRGEDFLILAAYPWTEACVFLVCHVPVCTLMLCLARGVAVALSVYLLFVPRLRADPPPPPPRRPVAIMVPDG
jgi:hypothetical protein